ncbi:MAG: CBS domain-containing protein [Sphingobacteriales bacterium]|nr:MAG: CBS domain-containing protein [Sphingobacteriales bacterium]
MLALELISNTILPLNPNHTVQRAKQVMASFKVSHLPIISDDFEYIGLIAEDDLIEITTNHTLINALSLNNLNSFVYQQQHVYDVIRTIYEQQLTVLPVLDNNQKYIGLITLQTIIECMATITAVQNAGGILVLEINHNDNSLAHIAQIIEAQDAQILSSYTKYFPQSTKIEITLKLNKIDINPIIAALLRYNYVIKATFNHSNDNDNINNRYQSLMNYLSF